MIFVEKEKFGALIRLTSERWDHVVARHPEIKSYLFEIKLALKDPEIVVENPYHKSEKYYHRYCSGLKNYIVVIVELEKRFIITAYIARKIKKGKILWTKN